MDQFWTSISMCTWYIDWYMPLIPVRLWWIACQNLSSKAHLSNQKPLWYFFMTCKAWYSVKHNFQQYNVCQNCLYIIDTCKFRKRRHQYPELGHTQGEIKKNLQKSTLAFKGGGRGRNSENHEIWWFLSLTLSFLFRGRKNLSNSYLYIFIYNILGFVRLRWWSSFPSIRPVIRAVIHPSKFLIPEEEDDARGGKTPVVLQFAKSYKLILKN
jgi:hypothetical protein